MDKPFIIKDLQKQVEDEVVEEGVEDKGPSGVGTSDMGEEAVAQTHEATKKEVLLTSNVVVTVDICIHLNSILNNILNSSNSSLMTKSPIPIPPQSLKPLSKHTPSPQHNLSMGHVTSSPNIS